MKLKITISILSLPILLQFTSLNFLAPQQKEKRYDERHISEFRYVIYRNEILGLVNDQRRIVHVLMDKDSFTEVNLAKMYSLIAKRYPEPILLDVWVATSLWQVATPEEADLPNFSGRDDDPHDGRYPQALLMRTHDKALFRYTPEGAPYINMKTVIISGIDPDSTKKR